MKKIHLPSLFTTAGTFLFVVALLFSGFVLQAYAQVVSSTVPSSNTSISQASGLSDDQLLQIGIQIWHNQCSVWNLPDDIADGITHKMKKGVTDWEDDSDDNSYALVGMGQFIWYPANGAHTYDEDWPLVVASLQKNGYPIKNWMLGSCPWTSREDFMAHFNGHKLTLLRKMLVKQPLIIAQTRCIAQRLNAALPLMLAAVDQDETVFDKEQMKQVIITHFNQLANSQYFCGLYALMDYVHFRGEGVLATERNPDGTGWGLRYALQEMDDNIIATDGPMAAFVKVAKALYSDENNGYNYNARYDTYLTFHFMNSAAQ